MTRPFRNGVRAGAILVLTSAMAACSFEPRVDRNGAQAGAEAPMKEVVEVPGVARLPVFSSAIRSGDFIFLSGAIGALPGDEIRLVEGGIGPETRQTLDNLQNVIEAAGGSMADMVKCTVFLADMADYAAMNEVYLEFFPSDPPARSALASGGLAFDARVEIECIAAAR
jgi:2-iminobutanoate/2-iminopropanoate deaminase